MLSTVRQRLETLETEYRARIAAIERDLAQPHAADFAEQASQRENEDVLRSLKLEAGIEHRRVQAALQRLDAGSFGACTQCGKTIETDRLEALPQAEHCMHCAGSPAS